MTEEKTNEHPTTEKTGWLSGLKARTKAFQAMKETSPSQIDKHLKKLPTDLKMLDDDLKAVIDSTNEINHQNSAIIAMIYENYPGKKPEFDIILKKCGVKLP